MKTSAEKVDELRRVLEAAAVDDPTLSSLYGAWRMIRPFARRPLERVLAGLRLDDSEQLDELLGLIAGAALELRSDPLEDPEEHPIAHCVCNRCATMYVELRAQARELLERVLAGRDNERPAG